LQNRVFSNPFPMEISPCVLYKIQSRAETLRR
jgi:hypothetical protein